MQEELTKNANPPSHGAAGSAFELKIVFPTKEARRIFAVWMCDGGGEQDYFRAMEESATPSLRIGYHGPENRKYPKDDRRRYGPFLCDMTLRIEALPNDQAHLPPPETKL